VNASARLRQHPLAAALYEALGRHRDAVLQAPTGAGKSTLVPLALLEGLAEQGRPRAAGGRILMLEPRRLAARAVAARMASLLGERVGATVGYRMRLDTRVSAATRIEVITEGVLTRMLQEDPALEGVAWLIFDEYHERSLQADLGLALALDARRELGAPFRVLIMSATLEAERIAGLLEDAQVVSVPGRVFEVQLRYLGRGPPLLPTGGGASGTRGGGGGNRGAEPNALERAVARAIWRALEESPGDVLVFLPGVGEIRRVQAELGAQALPHGVRVLGLYGQMSSEAQDAVLTPASAGTRKVVLATNVAETSLTIPGVTAVVDSGLVRRSRFDPVSGMSRLMLMRISRAASEQRTGRAGRVAPGICYRLWSEGAHASLAAATSPEILEADLAPLALELARCGIADAARLRWLDAPPAAALEQARELLVRLEALDARGAQGLQGLLGSQGAQAPQGRLTSRGQEMARLPVHPRLAHMLLAARQLGCISLAARLAALLSERDLLHGGGLGAGDGLGPSGGGRRDPDIRSRLELLQSAAASSLVVERLHQAARVLESAVARLATPRAAPRIAPGAASESAPRRGLAPALPAADLPGALLALAFPDRIGQRREGAEGRYLLANGRGAVFTGHSSLAREALIVAVELDDREREARIDLAVPLSAAALEALFAGQIISEEHFGWEPGAAAVVARRVRSLGAIVLEEQLLPVADDERALPAMLEGLRQLGIGVLPWDAGARGLQARMQFVCALSRRDSADWPVSDDATLLAELPQWLGPYLAGITRRAALTRVALREALLARLSGTQRRALETLAPRELVVPSGSAISIDYLDAQAPCISVRLQEVFGLADAPRIGGGTVAVTLKLLSPAQRPVQITRDLAGFWRSSYAEVRKELRGRYPKHYWPENPLEAAPTRGTRRAAARGVAGSGARRG